MKHFIFLITLFLFFFSLPAKENKGEGALSKIEQLGNYMEQTEKFSELYPQEKVYLHFDNTSYYLNEYIWFKAYVTTAEDHHLSPLSKTLYVELLNQEGFLVKRKVYPIINGQAKGDFLVTDSCEAGFYEIRAYTRWMRNWDADCVFSRTFPVFNAQEINNTWHQTMLQQERTAPVSYREKAENVSGKLQLLFFPEGGSMVNGISSLIAFKVIEEDGSSADNVVGKIYSKKDKKAITDIRTHHKGMGTFSLTPREGEAYMARITYRNESREFDLPQALPQGYTLQVNNYPPTRLIVTLKKSNDVQADTLGFTASCRGQVFASQVIFTSDSSDTRFSIPKENLPEGVMQLTVFNHKGMILAERMVYIHPTNSGDRIKINLEKENLDLNSAALNEVRLRLTDAEGRPVSRTGISVSVRDSKTELMNRDYESARVNLLLSSDLKGYIENPEYYFEKTDNVRLQHLDLLMLVQGWRRYNWQEMSGVTPFIPQFKIEKGITIDGYVTHLMNKNKPYTNARLSYMLFGGTGAPGFDFDELVTDDAGEFETTLQFFGTRPIVIQSRNEKNKRRETYIHLHRNFRPNSRALNPSELLTDFTVRRPEEENINELLAKMDSSGNQLNEVVVKGNKRRFKKRLPFGNIVIDVDRIIDEMRDEGIEPTLLSEVMAWSRPQHFTSDSTTRYKGKMMRYIFNDTGVMGIDTKKETFEEYCKREQNLNRWLERSRRHSNGSYSPIGVKTIIISEESMRETQNSTQQHNGEISVFILLHKDAYKKFDSYGIRTSRIQGYNHVSSFYSPQYIMGNPEAYDGRRTLMWMPDLMTDEQGYATFEFYNSPTCREFIFDAQCVTRDGKTGGLYQILNEKNKTK